MAGAVMQWSIFEIAPATAGSGLRGARRPVLVVSRETANSALPIVTVVPLATHRAGRRIYSNEVLLPSHAVGLGFDTVVMTHQTTTVPKRGLSARLASVDDPDLRSAVRRAMRVQLNLEEIAEYRVTE